MYDVAEGDVRGVHQRVVGNGGSGGGLQESLSLSFVSLDKF